MENKPSIYRSLNHRIIASSTHFCVCEFPLTFFGLKINRETLRKRDELSRHATWVERVLYKNLEHSTNVIPLVVARHFSHLIGYIIIMCWVNDLFNTSSSKKKTDPPCRGQIYRRINRNQKLACQSFCIEFRFFFEKLRSLSLSFPPLKLVLIHKIKR